MRVVTLINRILKHLTVRGSILVNVAVENEENGLVLKPRVGLELEQKGARKGKLRFNKPNGVVAVRKTQIWEEFWCMWEFCVVDPSF